MYEDDTTFLGMSKQIPNSFVAGLMKNSSQGKVRNSVRLSSLRSTESWLMFSILYAFPSMGVNFYNRQVLSSVYFSKQPARNLSLIRPNNDILVDLYIRNVFSFSEDLLQTHVEGRMEGDCVGVMLERGECFRARPLEG